MPAHGNVRVRDHFAILHIHSSDLAQVTGVSPITGDKLGDHCEHFGGVDSKAGTGTEKLSLPEPVWVQITAILITKIHSGNKEGGYHLS